MCELITIPLDLTVDVAKIINQFADLPALDIEKDIDGYKYCTSGKHYQPISQFGMDRSYLSSRCKGCCRKRARLDYLQKKDYYKEKSKKWYSKRATASNSDSK